MSASLAYVFWHWPRPGVSHSEYEARLFAFQASLKARGPSGLTDALSFRLQALPWANPRSVSYEDWYVVTGFGTLGALNDAAVDVANRAANDEVADEVSGSAGGLYKLLRTDLSLKDARFATWATKPARTTYQAFLKRLSDVVGDLKTDLWQRQMVLGPAPEFCIHSETRFELPKTFRPKTVSVRLVGRKGEEK